MNTQHIVIVGGGTAGWITASVLAKALPKNGYTISLIESPDIPTVGVGEATIPPIVNLLSFLDIDEKHFVLQVKATFKYGIHFQDWHEKNASYMHAFGLVGTNYQKIPFTDMWLQFREHLNLPPLNAFSATALAAYNNAFSPPHKLPDCREPGDFYPLSGLFYGYHFDSALLAKYLKNIALKCGVELLNQTVKDITLADNGNIHSLVLKNGLAIQGDVFVDCSGAKGLLNKQHLKVPFVSFKHQLPCDTAIALQTKTNTEPVPYTRSIAMSSGWRWQIPLQSRNGNGYVYASDFCTNEQATQELEQALNQDEFITETRKIQFDTGYLSSPWYKNSVAIGLSSGFFEPLESTSIHMIQKHVFALKDALLQSSYNSKQTKNAFNLSYQNDAEEIRDFLLMHYCTTKRNDSEFWQYCQQIKLPDSLVAKLEEYRRTGLITISEQSIFPYQSWLQVLTGQQVYPTKLSTQPHPNVTAENALMFFQSVNQSIGQQVMQLDSHQTYLTKLINQG